MLDWPFYSGSRKQLVEARETAALFECGGRRLMAYDMHGDVWWGSHDTDQNRNLHAMLGMARGDVVVSGLGAGEMFHWLEIGIYLGHIRNITVYETNRDVIELMAKPIADSGLPIDVINEPIQNYRSGNVKAFCWLDHLTVCDTVDVAAYWALVDKMHYKFERVGGRGPESVWLS